LFEFYLFIFVYLFKGVINTSTSSELQSQIKIIRSHLKGCELFEKYGTVETLCYIKNSCSSVDRCREALTKLTWSASKSNLTNSHLKVNEWIELMKDIQYLQRILYSHLMTSHECMEILLSSLLGSRSLENIELASNWLTDMYIVDKKCAVELAVKSAQQYYNSSANYFDSDMDFAKACLNVVDKLLKADSNKTSQLEIETMIQSEYNLINAMKIIAEFECSILPIQLRLNVKQRYQIIESILKKNDKFYKQHQKLLSLASLINCSKEEIMLLIANYTLNSQTFYGDELNVANEMCKGLIELNCVNAWQVIHRLASNLTKNLIDNYHSSPSKSLSNLSVYKVLGDTFKTIDSKYSTSYCKNLIEIERLLCFALTHCTQDFIETILNEKLTIRFIIDTLEEATNQTILSMRNVDRDSIKLETNIVNTDLLSTNKSIDISDGYFEKNRQILKGCLTSSNSDDLIPVLNYLAMNEMNLLLAYLFEMDQLQLEQLLADRTVFILKTKISYEFILYLISLNIINEMRHQCEDLDEESSSIYHFKSSTLISYVESLFLIIDNDDTTSSSNNNNSVINDKTIELFQKIISKEDSNSSMLLKWKSLFIKINRLYTEYKQTIALKQLVNDINLNKFQVDEVYRNEMILNLCQSDDTFQLAFSLAKFYSFDTWLCCVAYIKHIFNDSKLKEAKIKPILSTLFSRSNEFNEIMVQDILPNIDGADFDKLITFYSILNENNHKHLNHLKALKKFQSNNIKINYKQLLNNPYEVIESIIDEENLDLLCKMIPKLSFSDNSKALTTSQIHVIWCLKQTNITVNKFIKDANQSEQDPFNSDQFWSKENIRAYLNDFDANMGSYLKKMKLDTDWINFVEQLVLNKYLNFEIYSIYSLISFIFIKKK
jgi:hypothetical protein